MDSPLSVVSVVNVGAPLTAPVTGIVGMPPSTGSQNGYEYLKAHAKILTGQLMSRHCSVWLLYCPLELTFKCTDCGELWRHAPR